jgi:hypothetical protein
MAKRLLFFVCPALLIAACTTSKTPTAPTSAPSAVSGALAHAGHGAAVASTASAHDPNSAAHDKGTSTAGGATICLRGAATIWTWISSAGHEPSLEDERTLGARSYTSYELLL